MPEQIPGTRWTNPYYIVSFQPMPVDDGVAQQRIEVRYEPTLLQERKVAVLGEKFVPFVEELGEAHRKRILYGLLLLKRISNLDVIFVVKHHCGIYELKTDMWGSIYSTYFYVNGDTVVLLYCRLEEQRGRKNL